MVAALDESVSNLTGALHAAGMWDRTLLVFSTDNGGPITQAASNYPLRGGKATCWEGGTRGIGFVSGGARSGLSARVRGGESSAMIHVTDWLPTLCEVAGCALTQHGDEGGTHTGKMTTKRLDGVSAWGAISRGEARISPGEMRVLVAHRWVLHPRLEPGVIEKSQPEQLGGHGARYVRHARGWYA